jgi:DtxR family Mn-dependent transcriptional regulator
LEAWLVQILGYSWDEVHEEAERLEHCISEDFERRIAAAMGHPTRDPHGELIPTEDLKMPFDDSTPLSALRPHQTGIIQSVKGTDTGFLRYLGERGLVPGIRVEVKAYSPFDHTLTIKCRHNTIVLGLPITSKIYVKEDR